MTGTRRSPAFLIACLALVVALASATTAGYAAGKASGNSLIKKHSLSGNRLKPDTVTGKEVQESTLGIVPNATNATNATKATTAGHATLADTVPTPALVPFAYGAGWATETGFTSRAAGYRKDAGGLVHLQGAVTRTSGIGSVIAILPPGFRPTNFAYFPVYTSTAAEPGYVYIGADGHINFGAGGTTFLNLEGITFYPTS